MGKTAKLGLLRGNLQPVLLLLMDQDSVCELGCSSSWICYRENPLNQQACWVHLNGLLTICIQLAVIHTAQRLDAVSFCSQSTEQAASSLKNFTSRIKNQPGFPNCYSKKYCKHVFPDLALLFFPLSVRYLWV